MDPSNGTSTSTRPDAVIAAFKPFKGRVQIGFRRFSLIATGQREVGGRGNGWFTADMWETLKVNI